MCCCCALHCQLASSAVLTAAAMPQPAWDKPPMGPVGWGAPRTRPCSLHMELAPCRIAVCTPRQSCLPLWGFTICSFTLLLVFHECLKHWFGREYDFKSGVKSLIQPQMFTNTKIQRWETSSALDWVTALRGGKKTKFHKEKKKPKPRQPPPPNQPMTPTHPHTPKVTFSSVIKCPNRVICTLIHHQPLLIGSHTYEHSLGAVSLIFGTADRPRCTRSDENTWQVWRDPDWLMAQTIVQSCSDRQMPDQQEQGGQQTQAGDTAHVWLMECSGTASRATVECPALPIPARPLLFPRRHVPFNYNTKGLQGMPNKPEEIIFCFTPGQWPLCLTLSGKSG